MQKNNLFYTQKKENIYVYIRIKKKIIIEY